MSDFYDRDGNPISMRQWTRLHGDGAYRVVRQEHVGPYWVSTVWLGLDHGLMNPEPLIFETMVFGEGSWLDVECWRYPTLEEAQAGHERMCEQVRAVEAVGLTEP